MLHDWYTNVNHFLASPFQQPSPSSPPSYPIYPSYPSNLSDPSDPSDRSPKHNPPGHHGNLGDCFSGA